jgi:hypothetical protein
MCASFSLTTFVNKYLTTAACPTSYVWVMLKMCAETHAELQINCLLLLSKYKVAVKFIDIRINKNQFSSRQIVTCGQSDNVHGEDNSWKFATYCERAGIRRGHICYLPLRHYWVLKKFIMMTVALVTMMVVLQISFYRSHQSYSYVYK